MELVLPLPLSHCTRSPRAMTPRKVDGTSPPDQRWASADLSPGFSIQIQAWPVLQPRPRSRFELRMRIYNVSSREVSKDGGSTARRRPNLSITFSFLGVDRRFDVQAASLTFACFKTQHASRATVSTHSTFYEAFVSRFEATLSTPRDPDCSSHTALFTKPSFARIDTRAPSQPPLSQRLPFSN